MRCDDGKFRYATEAEAVKSARDYKAHTREHKSIKNRIVAYKCRFCPFWHVGHDRFKGLNLDNGSAKR